MKMFTTITEFIADERSHQTGTTSVSSVQYRCSAIDSVTQTLQRFCALPTRIVTSAKCNEQQLLQEIAVFAGTIEDIFTSFINTRTLLQSYTCINFVF